MMRSWVFTKRVARLAGALIASVFLSLGAVGAASADALDDYRAQGVIAERFDGYIEIRSGGDAAARALVDDVNARRREVYRQRAQQQNVSPADVGRVYAGQILQNAPSGTFFREENGGYRQK